ncbi:CocE/NonD family hydrolase [Ancylobacter sp. VNQ12]|uniref:CocE/NonD family hydrolase n=1 Tax=Ancylobacter sp. VNQ12 TaxID=3400920 RepID=UPI003BFEB978
MALWSLDDVRLEADVAVPMPDGVMLCADIYRPVGEGPCPVLLQRTPYNKRFAQTGVYQHPSWYARQGYVVVVQDVRGRYASDGEFYPYRHEAADGAATIEWAAHLPWTNGRVGTYGFSYAGASQMLAASRKPSGLVCCAVGCGGTDFYDGWTYEGGALHLAFILSWTLQSLAQADAVRRGDERAAARLAELADALPAPYRRPLHDWLADASLPGYVKDWLRHDTRDAYWRDLSPADLMEGIEVPCLHIGGWFDIFVAKTLRSFKVLSAAGRAEQNLMVGPWEHVPWARFSGVRDYGPDADNCANDAQLAWFDRWLKDVPQPPQPPVRYFLMGANHWGEADAWPPADTQARELNLRSTGRAGVSSRDGRLSQEPAGEDPADLFIFDPANPVPSRGGASCCFSGTAPIGSYDQRPVEIRNDVLLYTTDPLAAALDVIGDVTLELYAATDAPDTDWTAKLVDVHPDGRAFNVTEGIVRVRLRSGVEVPEPLPPGTVQRYDIVLRDTAYRFAAGHCLRLEVSSSNFPLFDVNSNSGKPAVAVAPADLRLATQCVFHDVARPSRLRFRASSG